MNNLFCTLFYLFGLFRVNNASTDATNGDADTENETDATFSSCITAFPEKPYQPLSFKLPARTFGNNPKELSYKSQWYQKHPWWH